MPGPFVATKCMFSICVATHEKLENGSSTDRHRRCKIFISNSCQLVWICYWKYCWKPRKCSITDGPMDDNSYPWMMTIPLLPSPIRIPLPPTRSLHPHPPSPKPFPPLPSSRSHHPQTVPNRSLPCRQTVPSIRLLGFHQTTRVWI